MIAPALLKFRVADIEIGVEVAGFVSPSDADDWVARENARIGREVYEVVEKR